MDLVSRILDLASPRSRERRKEKKRTERMAVRQKTFQSETWRHHGDISQRRYENYQEYFAHQVSKLDRIGERLRGHQERDRIRFVERFAGNPAFERSRVVICLGARLGAEVAALHELGHFAVGIDLNPGKSNPYVLYGDFHRVMFPDSSADVVFTNALDHAFDLEMVMSEVRRLLRPGGVFLVELIAGHEEGFCPGEYESMHWKSSQDFARRIADMSGLRIEEERDLGKVGRDNWTQLILRKPEDLP
jgi:SAM-dependent methyltransferase